VNPQPWEIDVALDVVGSRLGYPGTIKGGTIDKVGPSGRPLAITLRGDAGPKSVEPHEFRQRLGLRSTLYKVSAGKAEKAPPPPKEKADAGVVGAEVAGVPDDAIQAPVTDSRMEFAKPSAPVPDIGGSTSVDRQLLIAEALGLLVFAYALLAVAGIPGLQARVVRWLLPNR
jgi:hypothetical protein